jgi:hypothetical protein
MLQINGEAIVSGSSLGVGVVVVVGVVEAYDHEDHVKMLKDMKVERAREKRGQMYVRGVSPGATDPAVALSPITTTITGHVVLL